MGREVGREVAADLYQGVLGGLCRRGGITAVDPSVHSYDHAAICEMMVEI